MRVSTRIVIDIETGQILARDSYEYHGSVEKCCGGDALAGAKQQEANQQIQLNQQMMSMMHQYQDASQPFLMDQLKNGLPFFNQLTDYSKGTLATAEAPQRAALNRSLSSFGDTLPSGFKEQANTNFDVAQGHAFDQDMVSNLLQQQNAKERAASALNPLGPASLGSSTAGSVLSAPPVQAGGVGNFLGGAVSGLLDAAGQAKGFGKLFAGI